MSFQFLHLKYDLVHFLDSVYRDVQPVKNQYDVGDIIGCHYKAFGDDKSSSFISVTSGVIAAIRVLFRDGRGVFHKGIDHKVKIPDVEQGSKQFYLICIRNGEEAEPYPLKVSPCKLHHSEFFLRSNA